MVHDHVPWLHVGAQNAGVAVERVSADWMLCKPGVARCSPLSAVSSKVPRRRLTVRLAPSASSNQRWTAGN